jgi:hypothetical protein
MVRIKGNRLLVRLKYLEKLGTEQEWETFRDRLSDPLKQILHKGIIPGFWYDVKYFVEIHQQAGPIYGKNRPRLT